MDDPYRVLGVPSSASWPEIKKAFRAAAQIFHPDRFVGMSEEVQSQAAARMKQATAAYDELERREQARAARGNPSGAGDHSTAPDREEATAQDEARHRAARDERDRRRRLDDALAEIPPLPAPEYFGERRVFPAKAWFVSIGLAYFLSAVSLGIGRAAGLNVPNGKPSGTDVVLVLCTCLAVAAVASVFALRRSNDNRLRRAAYETAQAAYTRREQEREELRARFAREAPAR